MKRSDRAKKGILISLLGSLFNLILSSVKISIGLIAGSISVLLDGINNFIDIFTAVFTALGFGISNKENNERYPNGYGRIEYIIGFLVSIVVIFVGITFVFSAIERLLIPQPIGFSWIYFYILIASVIAKIAMGEMYRRSDKKLNSLTLSVMVYDSYQDAGITVFVLLSFFVSQYTKIPVDALCALIMATVIFFNWWKLAAKSFKRLLGKTNEILHRRILIFLNSFDFIVNVSKLYLYDYGYQRYSGTAIVEIADKNIPVKKAIELNNLIKKKVYEKFGIKIEISYNSK